MYKYFTNAFDYWGDIDEWLKSFEREVSTSEGNHAEVVGYVAVDDKIVITVKRWEVLK